MFAGIFRSSAPTNPAIPAIDPAIKAILKKLEEALEEASHRHLIRERIRDYDKAAETCTTQLHANNEEVFKEARETCTGPVVDLLKLLCKETTMTGVKLHDEGSLALQGIGFNPVTVNHKTFPK